MRVTKEEILKIKSGASKMFALDNARACNSARVCVQYVKRCCKPDDVSDYKTEIDWQQNIIRVTAVPNLISNAD